MEEPVDLFAAAAAAAAEDDEDEDGEGEGNDEDGEPEDDFNAAWEVLDLARAIYQKQSADDEEVALKLADTYIALGDVSMETGASRVLLPPLCALRGADADAPHREIRAGDPGLRSGPRAQARAAPDVVAADRGGALQAEHGARPHIGPPLRRDYACREGAAERREPAHGAGRRARWEAAPAA